jgi:uncharacterized protein (DUF1501 family)
MSTHGFSRRGFLKGAGLALFGAGTLPGFLQRASAQARGGGRKVLVTLFLRGGADGLSLVPPLGDPDYARLRPNLALRAGGEHAAPRLDDVFGLHPALGPLLPLWDTGALAVVHAVGQPGSTRSHFDAQDFLEAGTPGQRASDGWANRALQASPDPDASTFRAVALQPRLPRALLGPAPALAFNAVADFKLRAGRLSAVAATSFEALYAQAVDEALNRTGGEAFGALRQVDQARIAELPPAHGAVYPRSPLGKRLQDIARLIRADVGLELAVTESGGWDTHVAQGAGQGQLANRVRDLGECLAAFATDLGDGLADVCLVALTEFGRTARENGNRGTDHGTASAMLVLGGGVRGRRVLGSWPGLAEAHLFEGRDLRVTTDYRAVLSDVLLRVMGVGDAAAVFPGYVPPPGGGLGLF